IASSAQDQPPPAPIVRSIAISGTREVAEPTLRAALGVREGDPLSVSVEDLDRRLEGVYRDQDYTFARGDATFDADTGHLSIDVDEGVIGAVEFTGIDEQLARAFAGEFALRAGDVFNLRRARQALDVLLQPTRGAVRPGRVYARTMPPSSDLAHRPRSF